MTTRLTPSDLSRIRAGRMVRALGYALADIHGRAIAPAVAWATLAKRRGLTFDEALCEREASENA